MSHILIIEDEQKIQEILTEFLQENGYTVDNAHDGLDGLTMFKTKKYDLILLDIMMPRIDGFAVLELLRKDSDVPVIFITAMEDEKSQMKGFDLMADDYIVKPFSMNLVIRRVEAVLRRKQAESPTGIKTLEHRDVVLDTQSCEVRVSGRVIPFTYIEFKLLKLLLENKNKVFTRDDLLRITWGYDFIADDKVVNNHIMRIRKKLGEDFIVTVRGVGYKIDG
jgi:two-component system response regulator VanR